MTRRRLGTRGSELALAQAGRVANLLRGLGHEIALVKIETSGDRIQGPLSKAGGKGLWLREIEQSLLEGSIDLAVHSAKDMPVDLADGLTIGAYPEREDPRDVFIGAPGRRFAALPPAEKTMPAASKAATIVPRVTRAPKRSTLAWRSASAVFTTWRIRLARFAGSLRPRDRP